jgi:aminoglycoside/choline kinase family phosphotransferase
MLFGKSIAGFTEVMKEWNGYEKYVEHFEVYSKSYLSKVLKTYAPNRTDFGYNVLNHADFHVKNVMFKKTSNGVDDFKFVSLYLCGLKCLMVSL